MQLPDAFDVFLDRISLGVAPTRKIEIATNGLATYLTDELFLPAEAVFLQGSYPNRTAVVPDDSDNGEYDADLVCICGAAGASADKALEALEETLAKNRTYARLLEREGTRKVPCVRLRYADDEVGGFHVDIVPARASTSTDPEAPLEIPRRGEGWHDTAPAEYTEWCVQRGERFARTVKMVKRWREVHQPARSSIKSIVLQVLAANNLGMQGSDAEALTATLRAIQSVLAGSPSRAPVVRNPVLQAENLAARWRDADYKNFLVELGEAVRLSEAALASQEIRESHRYWRELLGSDFPQPPEEPGRRRTRVMPVTPPPGYHDTQEPLPRERYGC